uniref:Uncharacterized protein n=1 Tax=Anguilla anguilla TaxID=7936 RepID=A0A0E9Y0Z8_ANGAN
MLQTCFMTCLGCLLGTNIADFGGSASPCAIPCCQFQGVMLQVYATPPHLK